MLLGPIMLMAQPQPGGKDKHHRPSFKEIVEKRYEVIVHGLELDEGKAQQLKPMYMDYCQSIGKLFKRRKQFKPREQCTEEEIEQDIREDFKRSKQMVSIREKYYEKFRTLLSPRQIEKSYDIEREEQSRMMKHRRPAPKP